MSTNNDFVGIRLSDNEMAFLKKIAIEHQLYKKNNEPSLGLAIKHLIREKISEKNQGKDAILADEINHLVKIE